MMRNPIRLLGDERGASIVEMALAAPLLATFLIGMTDLSRAYSAKLQVEQAAQRTVEMVQRNGFTAGTEATLKTEAETAAGTGSTATVTSALECTSGSTVTSKAYTDTCANGESYARYVRVTITKGYTPFFRVKWDRRTSSGSSWTVHGSAGVRTQ